MSQEFVKLNNAHAGKTAYVIGKGPSLDAFIERTFPRDGVLIGVNDVGKYVPLDYSLTCDGYYHGQFGGLQLVGIPASSHARVKDRLEVRDGDVWYLHVPDPNREWAATRLPRSQVAHSRWLAAASSSIQPAIHLAWYLGCSELVLVGCDGRGGYARAIEHKKTMSKDAVYAMIRRDTVHLCSLLFPGKWRDHVPRGDNETLSPAIF